MTLRVSKNFRRRGSALSLAIMVSVVISGMVMTLAWVAGEDSQRTGGMSKSDAAFYAAEAGAQRAAYFLKKNPSSYHSGSTFTGVFTATPFVSSGSYTIATLTGTVGGASYTTTCTLNTDYTLQVTSVGTNGASTYTLSETLYPPSAGVPTFASGGDWDNWNIHVVGDIATKGAFDGGNGNGDVTGNVYYGTTATRTSSVGGVVAWTDPTTLSSVNWTTLQSTLDTAVSSEVAGGDAVVYNNPADGTTFNFNQIHSTSTDRVIKVVGDVVNPNFQGSGTFYVQGSVKFTDNRSNSNSIGSSAKPINIVTLGTVSNLSFSKKTDVYGSLYVQGNWTSDFINVYGMVYVEGTVTSTANGNNGTGTLGVIGMTTPFFDTRAPSGSIVTTPMRTTNFTGPQP